MSLPTAGLEEVEKEVRYLVQTSVRLKYNVVLVTLVAIRVRDKPAVQVHLGFQFNLACMLGHSRSTLLCKSHFTLLKVIFIFEAMSYSYSCFCMSMLLYSTRKFN